MFLQELFSVGCSLNEGNCSRCFHSIITTRVNTMIITTPAATFTFQQPATVDDAVAPTAPGNSDPHEQPLARSKRGIKDRGLFSWFGSKPAAVPPVVVPVKPPVALKPVVPPTPKPRTTGKPPGAGQLSPTHRFQNLGDAVVHANKVKKDDALLLANLAKQSPKISVAEAAKRLIDADSLVKAGVISTAPKAGQVARDAFISAGITGMVSAPINVGAYAGSVATGEAIKANYAPGVLPPPFLPSATSQPKSVTPAVQSETALGPQLDDAEAQLLGMASTVMFILGDTQSVFTKNEGWPKDDAGRLSNLEKLLDVSEQQLKKATRQNGIIFKPYKPGTPVPADAKARLELIEKRFERMAESYEKVRVIAAIKQSENEEHALATA